MKFLILYNPKTVSKETDYSKFITTVFLSEVLQQNHILNYSFITKGI